MFYSSLDVKKSATEDEIKAAYRKLALKHHPDKNAGGDTAEKFQEIQRAYEVLGDKDKRAEYDNFVSKKKEKLRGFVRPEPFERPPKQPFIFLMQDDKMYIFDGAPDRVRCGLQSGDTIAFGSGPTRATGVFIGVATDDYLYWCKDATSWAQRLSHRESDMAMSSIAILQKGNLEPKRMNLPVSSLPRTPRGAAKSPRPGGAPTALELKAMLRKKEEAKHVKARLEKIGPKEEEARAETVREEEGDFNELAACVTLTLRALRLGLPMEPSMWRRMGLHTNPTARAGSLLGFEPEREVTLSMREVSASMAEFSSTHCSVAVDSEPCRTPPPLTPDAAHLRAGTNGGFPPNNRGASVSAAATAGTDAARNFTNHLENADTASNGDFGSSVSSKSRSSCSSDDGDDDDHIDVQVTSEPIPVRRAAVLAAAPTIATTPTPGTTSNGAAATSAPAAPPVKRTLTQPPPLKKRPPPPAAAAPTSRAPAEKPSPLKPAPPTTASPRAAAPVTATAPSPASGSYPQSTHSSPKPKEPPASTPAVADDSMLPKPLPPPRDSDRERDGLGTPSNVSFARVSAPHSAQNTSVAASPGPAGLPSRSVTTPRMSAPAPPVGRGAPTASPSGPTAAATGKPREAVAGPHQRVASAALSTSWDRAANPRSARFSHTIGTGSSGYTTPVPQEASPGLRAIGGSGTAGGGSPRAPIAPIAVPTHSHRRQDSLPNSARVPVPVPVPGLTLTAESPRLGACAPGGGQQGRNPLAGGSLPQPGLLSSVPLAHHPHPHHRPGHSTGAVSSLHDPQLDVGFSPECVTLDGEAATLATSGTDSTNTGALKKAGGGRKTPRYMDATRSTAHRSQASHLDDLAAGTPSVEAPLSAADSNASPRVRNLNFAAPQPQPRTRYDALSADELFAQCEEDLQKKRKGK